MNAQHNVGISNIVALKQLHGGLRLRIAALDFGRGVTLETPQNMELLRIMTQKITHNEGSSNVIALKNSAKHGILMSHYARNSHCGESAIKRKILDLMV